MKRPIVSTVLAITAIILLVGGNAFAQQDEGPIKIFGYFQSEFEYQDGGTTGAARNSFILQQLNIFFQKPIAQNWSSFVNFELVNTFSSSRQWGALNIEEAWVRYRYNRTHNLKLGLSIPIFNNFNEIKNRSPLHPYIIRPLVYESSFEEFLGVGVYLPTQAWVQAYGFVPAGDFKFDYALYLGNSPNIDNQPGGERSGIDTSSTIMVGGRIGIRHRELKAGFSLAHDNDNLLAGIEEDIGVTPGLFREMPRFRLGTDLSYRYDRLSLETELINVTYDEKTPGAELDLKFFYATLGFQVTERFSVFGTYWNLREEFFFPDSPEPEEGSLEFWNNRIGRFDVVGVGVFYMLNERLSAKGQYGRVSQELEVSRQVSEDDPLDWYAAAISVFF